MSIREFRKWEDPSQDPAMQPVIEGGGGESEGFELAEEELIEHASHGDSHGTAKITEDAEHVTEEQAPDPDRYGEADDIASSELRDPEQRSE